MTFYETLSQLMKEKRISASELSRRTGISTSFFTELKKGRVKDVSFENALRIFDALGVTPNEFAERQGWFNESHE